MKRLWPGGRRNGGPAGCLRYLAIAMGSAALCVAQTRPATEAKGAIPLEQFSDAVEALMSRVSPSVVRISVTRFSDPEPNGARGNMSTGTQESIGSGVVVDPDGYILTNAHVVEGAESIRVDLVRSGANDFERVLAQANQMARPAKVVGTFKEGDLALIKINEKGLHALPFGDYSKLRQGQVVFALGSPSGLQNSVSMGVVSSVARQPNPDSPFLYIQTDTPINPGNSGGPLLNAAGEVIGLNTFIVTQSGGNEGIGFAIPSTLLEWVTTDLKKNGHVDRSSFGFDVQAITPTLAAALKLPRRTGVVVTDVLPGGPAETAGMKVNDVLVDVDRHAVENVPSMLGLFFQHSPNESVKFHLLRGTEDVTLDIRPVAQAHAADKLIDLADAEKDRVPELGIVGLTTSPELKPILGPLRLPLGVVVAARLQASARQETGLQTSDVIHTVNQTLVNSLDDLREAMAKLKAGDPVALLIERAGQLQYLSFVLQ